MKVSILYTPDSAENRKAAEEVAASLDSARCAVTVKKAAGSVIADVTGADIVFFGLHKAGDSEIPEGFRELARIFKGINLAGRAAGIFNFGPEKSGGALRKILKATDISLADVELSLGEKGPQRQAEIKEWARQTVSLHQEGRNAGK